MSASEETKEETTPGDEAVIYLVRHGKTFFNTTGQVQGFADSPLTEKGVEQAVQVGKGMKDMAFVTAFSSDLGRQRATAKYILAENANPVPELTELYGLREWNYGGFEGKTNAEMWTPIFEKYDLTFDEDWTDYATLVSMLGDEGIADAIAESDPLGEAETYAEIVERSQAAMDQIVADTLAAGGGNALVVSSGGEIPTLLTMLVPEQYQGQDIGNCSVTVLTYKDGEYTLGVVGDTSYLEG